MTQIISVFLNQLPLHEFFHYTKTKIQSPNKSKRTFGFSKYRIQIYDIHVYFITHVLRTASRIPRLSESTRVYITSPSTVNAQ